MYKAPIATAFARLINEVLKPALKEYCPKNGITFLGYYLVQFERTGPEDGRIWINGKEISREALRAKLRMD